MRVFKQFIKESNFLSHSKKRCSTGTEVSGGDPLRVQLPVIGCCDKPIISKYESFQIFVIPNSFHCLPYLKGEKLAAIGGQVSESSKNTLKKVIFHQTLKSAVVSGGDPLRVQLPVIGCCDKPIISDRKREFS